MAQSFHDSADLKQAMVQKARSFQESGAWVSRPLHWDGETGSLVGALLESEDLDQWNSQFGLPKWLALLLDMVAATISTPKEGMAAQLALLEAVPVGVDLDRQGNLLILRFLRETEKDLAFLDADHPLRVSLRDAMELHDMELAGAAPKPALWRKVRSAAIAETDRAVKESPEAQFGGVIEAATWSPRTSRSVVPDTFRSWVNARRDAAVQRQVGERGLLTVKETKSLLEKIHEEEKKKRKDKKEFIHVFGILEEKYPKEHASMMDFLRTQHKESLQQWENALGILLGVFEEAHCPDRCTC